jgi:hypothetical protein
MTAANKVEDLGFDEDNTDPKELIAEIEKKLEDYDPTKLRGKDESEFSGGESLGFFALAHKSKGCDLCLFYGGVFFSVFFGVAQPASIIVFARLINDFGGAELATMTPE